MSEERQEFWAIVEIMGHSRFAGLVQETTLAGQGFIRLRVPKSNDGAGWAFEKLISPSSVYAITPCEERTARLAAGRFRSEPFELYDLDIMRRQALPEREPDGWVDMENDAAEDGTLF